MQILVIQQIKYRTCEVLGSIYSCSECRTKKSTLEEVMVNFRSLTIYTERVKRLD